MRPIKKNIQPIGWIFFGGPGENRTPATRMQTECTTTMLQAQG
jgi:hypothetical protein